MLKRYIKNIFKINFMLTFNSDLVYIIYLYNIFRRMYLKSSKLNKNLNKDENLFEKIYFLKNKNDYFMYYPHSLASVTMVIVEKFV